ncbi:MAG: hypothetical protein K0B14_18655, partial [Anaerolineaceae bacterium]|nr:hypothetical protein [Anaerolineaceae bacterium]
MDNHENNDDALKNQEDANAESPREDVPLWLQGIEEPLDDETKPINATKDQTGNWIREIEDINSESLDEDAPDLPEDSDLDKAEFETEVNVNAFEELSQLEHIEDVSGKGETKADEIAGDQEDSEITEEFVVDSLIDQPPYDDIDSDMEELATDEGFVDISQLGLDQQTGDAVEYIDDESLREGDLPEWLQEMIAESEQETGEEGDIDIK